MPTARKRHLVTETDELAAALDEAARVWPEDGARRSRLLLRLVGEGHRAITAERERAGQERRAAVRASSGAATGMYGDGYLERLRHDWPD